MTEKEVQKNQPPRLHAHADMDVLTILYQRAGIVVSGFRHPHADILNTHWAGV